jgi:multisubunit Na+/H+ antiporter MnhG subunit
MSHSANFYNQFFTSVSAGLLLVVLGAVLLLVAAVGFARRPEPFAGDRPPSALRALSTIGFVIFLLGIAWQLIGYARFVAWPR